MEKLEAIKLPPEDGMGKLHTVGFLDNDDISFRVDPTRGVMAVEGSILL